MNAEGYVLRVTGLRKSYRGKPAVNGVDLRVAPGERVALVGPNGAGKTTTLMSCLGGVRPDAGTVELLGQRSPAARRAALADVGFAAGYLPLPPHLRVIEYLSVFGRLYGWSRPAGQARRGLETYGIEHLADRIGTELSSGQRTLVGIVKATMHRPALLVLDEPTASLDPDVALRVRTGLIAQCDRDGTALLVTSHNMAEVECLAHRVVFLAAGRVVADGAPMAIAASLGQSSLEDVYLQLSSTTPAVSAANSGTGV
ncbi:MAG TPA: ABC transporter ATP-binding protein [Pilimelia sp.]|nr:ABC transporter ATP-binding protein [Pilimelia sp.]